jgi:hypothetical protein
MKDIHTLIAADALVTRYETVPWFVESKFPFRQNTLSISLDFSSACVFPASFNHSVSLRGGNLDFPSVICSATFNVRVGKLLLVCGKFYPSVFRPKNTRVKVFGKLKTNFYGLRGQNCLVCSSVDPPPWVNIDFPTDETFPSPPIVGKKVKVVGKFPTG